MSAQAREKGAASVSPLADHIDFGHLERYTMGEPTLTEELLRTFCAELSAYAPDIADPVAERAALHRLKGAARAIGAFPLADSAEWLEKMLEVEADEADVQAARAELDEQLRALKDACRRWKELVR